jgi:hypothetical protein
MHQNLHVSHRLLLYLPVPYLNFFAAIHMYLYLGDLIYGLKKKVVKPVGLKRQVVRPVRKAL